MSQHDRDWPAIAMAIQSAIDLDTAGPKSGGGRRGFAAEWLQSRVLRKLEPLTAESKDSADRASLKTLLACNRRCKAWVLRSESDFDKSVDANLRHILWQWTSGLSLGAVFAEHWSTGPGAIQGSHQNDLYTKLFDCSLTATTRGLYIRYLHVAQGYPTLLEAEKFRRARHSPLSIVKGSKISFVPKDSRSSRTIGTEASVNMLAQKAIAWFLEERIKTVTGNSLNMQASINRRYARAGSRDGNLATLDQSSASDHISVAFCKEFLPAETFRTLMEARSPMFHVPYGAGHWVTAYIMSGMGNSFTFPLQTLIFRAIAVATCRALGLPEKEVQVFGDDVICRSDCSDQIVRSYQRLGFRLNLEKSYTTGPFRESCGGDYYEGYCVKPVYIRELSSRFDLISAFNRLRVWGLKQGILLFRTLLLLRRLIGRAYYQPFPEPDGFGEAVGSDPCEGIWCTREQALRRGARHVGHGLIHFHTYVRRRRSILVRTPNGAGLMVAACSGKVTSSSVSSANTPLCVIPKRESWDVKRVRCYSSVWPAIDRWSYWIHV